MNKLRIVKILNIILLLTGIMLLHQSCQRNSMNSSLARQIGATFQDHIQGFDMEPVVCELNPTLSLFKVGKKNDDFAAFILLIDNRQNKVIFAINRGSNAASILVPVNGKIELVAEKIESLEGIEKLTVIQMNYDQ